MWPSGYGLTCNFQVLTANHLEATLSKLLIDNNYRSCYNYYDNHL